MHSRGLTSDWAVHLGVYVKTNLFPQVHRRYHDRWWSNGDKYCQFRIRHCARGGSVIFTKARGMTLYDTPVHGAHIPRLCWKNDLYIIFVKNYLELNYFLKRVITRNVTHHPIYVISSAKSLIIIWIYEQSEKLFKVLFHINFYYPFWVIGWPVTH